MFGRGSWPLPELQFGHQHFGRTRRGGVEDLHRQNVKTFHKVVPPKPVVINGVKQ